MFPHWPIFNPILEETWRYYFTFYFKKAKNRCSFVPGGVVFTNPPKN